MLKKILIALVLAIAAFSILVATRPADFRIARSATISGTPSAVFAELNNLQAWEAWSPWAKLDPNMKTTYSGPTSGAGAQSAWQGNSDVGEGSMTILESVPGERVTLRLEFIEPFAALNQVDFTLTPQGDATNVTWAMTGRNNFMAKAFSLVMDMDALVGKDFEKGLAQLKQVVETGAGN